MFAIHREFAEVEVFRHSEKSLIGISVVSIASLNRFFMWLLCNRKISFIIVKISIKIIKLGQFSKNTFLKQRQKNSLYYKRSEKGELKNE